MAKKVVNKETLGQVDWLSPRSPKASMAFISEISSVCSRKGAYSRHLDSLLQNGKLRDVIEFNVPFEGIELDDYRAARQIQGLLSKNPWVDLGFNPLREGVLAFIKAEQKCAETNVFWEHFRPIGRVGEVFRLATRKMKSLLGDVPPLSALKLRYGPGANTSVTRATASMSSKLGATLSCSEDMLPTLGGLMEELPMLVEHNCEKNSRLLSHFLPVPGELNSYWVKQRVEVRVDDGKLVFVPKDAKTHRPIIVEPLLNGLFQLGVGTYLKRRLASSSIDLKDQGRNRKLAREGSVTGGLATVDLSSASDTISWELVVKLLPPEWLDFLGQFRTGSFRYSGGPSYQLEKFSSMGNGFTFELESCIFYALALGCVTSVGADASNVSVYGDDIIIPVEAMGLLDEVLSLAGFWVNTKKSFWQGPFRESCGADWLSGNDVRPFYLREDLSDKSLYNFHNWAMRRGERDLAAVCEAWTWEPIRLYGPDGYGDGHLIGSHALYKKRKYSRRGYCGGWFDTYSLRPKRYKTDRSSDWLIPSYSIYMRGEEDDSLVDPYVLKGSVGYVRTPIYTMTESIFWAQDSAR